MYASGVAPLGVRLCLRLNPLKECAAVLYERVEVNDMTRTLYVVGKAHIIGTAADATTSRWYSRMGASQSPI